MCGEAIARISNLYSNSVSIVVVNNVLGKAIHNTRLSIRQGDKASMKWFTYGIDPIINYLKKRLKGILIHSTPVQGPLLAFQASPLPPHELRYKLIAYCDDVNIMSKDVGDLVVVDEAVRKFESFSGAILSRNKKCQIIGFGSWEDREIWPIKYLKTVKEIKVFGVFIMNSYKDLLKRNWSYRFEKFEQSSPGLQECLRLFSKELRWSELLLCQEFFI